MNFSWESVKRAVRFTYLKIIRQKISTHAIASGMAAGVFAGCLPIVPFQTVIAVTLAFLIRGSKIAAAAGTYVSNPLNWIPFYAACYYIGSIFYPFEVHFDPQHMEFKHMLEQGWGLVAVMLTGGLVIGVPSTFLSYVITFRVVTRYRQQRMIRLIKKYKAKQAEREVDADVDTSSAE